MDGVSEPAGRVRGLTLFFANRRNRNPASFLCCDAMKLTHVAVVCSVLLGGCDDSGSKAAPEAGAKPEPSAQTPGKPTEAAASAKAEQLSSIELKLPADAEAQAEKLAGNYRDGAFDNADYTPENTSAFLWLATHRDDPALVGAALSALADSGGDDPEKIDANVLKVAISGLGSEQDSIFFGAAMAATSVSSTETLDPRLRAALETALLSKSSLDRRLWIANRTLGSLADWNARASLLTKVIDPKTEPLELVTLATSGAGSAGAAGPAKEQLRALAQGLLDHPDPGLRGVAVRTFGYLAERGDPATSKLLVAKLDDPEAFVRACAATGLGRMRAQDAIKALSAKLEDEAKSGRTIEAQGPEGRKERYVLSGTTQTVSRAVVQALVSISYSTKKRLELGTINYRDPKSVEAATKLAADWARDNG